MTIQQIQDAINNKTLNERQLINVIADYLQENAPSSSPNLVKSVTLTDAQIKALPTTDLEIIAVPGVGKYYNIISVTSVMDTSNGLYGNVNSDLVNVDIGGLSQMFLFSLGLNEGASQYVSYASVGSDNLPYDLNLVENQPIKLSSNNTGNFTGGHSNNTLKVTVYYTIIDL